MIWEDPRAGRHFSEGADPGVDKKCRVISVYPAEGVEARFDVLKYGDLFFKLER